MEINTSNVSKSKQYTCLFCCKLVQNLEANSFPCKSYANVRKFFRFLCRFLCIENLSKTQSFSILNYESVCIDCSSLVHSFSNLYHEMKCVELQIQQKVDTLVCIMKEANRVPSRMKLVKQILEIQGEDEYNNFLKNRLNFIKSCTKGMSRLYPKVVLDRVKPPKVPITACLQKQENVNDDGYCQWIISFIAITVLLLPTHSNSTEAFSPEDCDIIFEDVSYEHLISLEETDQEQFTHNHEFAKDPESEPCSTPPPAHNQTKIVEASLIDDFIEPEDVPLEVETKISPEYQEHVENSSTSEETDNSNDKVELQTFCKLNTANHQEEKTENKFLKEESNVENQVADDDRETVSQLETKPEILTKNSDLSLSCSFCPRKLVNKSALSRHVYHHHAAKIPLVNKMRPYYCRLCKRGYITYHQYLTHRKTLMHSRKLKQKQSRSGSAFKDDILIENPTKSKPREQQNTPSSQTFLLTIPTELQQEVSAETSEQTISKVKENLDSSTTVVNTSSTGYQLRKRRKITVAHTESSSESSISSDENEPNFSDNESSSSISSDNSNLSENKMHTQIKTRLRNSFARCSVNGCKYTAETEATFKEHQKLHKQGNYTCMFCESHQITPLDLAMHETENHSKPNSKQKKSGLYICSRCPYQNSQKFRYVNHFVHFHLGLQKVSMEECSICQMEMLPRYSKKHFETCHDTNKVAPEKILKCNEDNCSAYFISKRGLRQHKLEKHMDLEIEDEEETELGKLACNVCGKSFRRYGSVKVHKQLYHKQVNDLESEVQKSCRDSLICTYASCTKSFPEMSDMKKHLTLHGNFKCDMCDEVKDYAPALAIHELEHDSELRLKKYLCQRCLYRTDIEGAYITHHLETHLKLTDNLYSCSVCEKHFKSRNNLTSHFQNNHGDKNGNSNLRKNCDKCTAYFLQDIQLMRHKTARHGDTQASSQFKCNISSCIARFETSTQLQSHKKLHGDFSCKFCSIKKEYAEDIAIHELEHQKLDNNGNFECARCEFSTTGNVHIYLNHFVKKHLDLTLKFHRCTICQVSLADKCTLKRHMKRLHCIEGLDPSKVQKCDKCPAYFRKAAQLMLHKRDHGMDRKNLNCLLCGKSFRSDSGLRFHNKNFHGIGKSNKAFEFGCDVPNCDKRFQTKEELEWHKEYSVAPLHVRGSENHIQWKKPSVKEQATCELCGGVFKGIASLKIHMTKIHRPDRPTEFKCDKCDKEFKNKAGLKSHQEFHKPPEEWKYICSVCSKKCALKNLLDQHMRTHSKEKPYVCQVCGEKYAHRHNLRNHVNSKHKDEGVQDIPKKFSMRFHVSRKGKKLGKDFSFIREQTDSAE